MAAIFILSAQPNLRVTDEAGLDLLVRKIGHMVAFGVLGVLLFQALSGARGSGRRAAAALAFTLTALYAVSDEVHQAFVAGREPAATDVLIDAVGAAAALFIWTRRGP